MTGVAILISIGSVSAQVKSWRDIETEADTLLAHEDYNGALKLYNRSIELSKLKEPDSYASLYKRAVCYYSLANFKEALSNANQMLTKDPGYHQAYLLKAFIGRELNDSQTQIEGLNPLLELDPENADLLKWRATVLLDANQYAAARRDIQLLKKNSSEDPELELYLGVSYYYESKADSALFCFDKAIALDKTYSTPYIYASSLCLDEEAYSLALQYAEAGLKLDPENMSMTFYKGIALAELKRIDEGCSCLYKAFNKGIDDAAGYLKEYCYGAEE